MKQARLIVTFACNRNCENCCNEFSSIVGEGSYIDDISILADFDVVCVTGGEPLVRPELTEWVLTTLRLMNPRTKVYLYTASYTSDIPRFLRLVGGVQYSIHENPTAKDVEFLKSIQDEISVYGRGSHRLNVDSRVPLASLPIKANVWTRIQSIRWMTEEELRKTCPVSQGKEQLFMLRGN